jgi:DNA-binding response OmpR family regulator
MSARVLLIEDEPEWHRLLRDILEEQDYSVDVATTREDAKRRLKSAGYDLILVDACLEKNTFDLECQQFCNYLRQAGGGVPIVALTSKDINPAEMWTLFQLKIVDFIFKPTLMLPDVRRRVQDALQRKSPDPLAFPNSETEKPEFAYHVFVSYSSSDRDWVTGWLWPRLQAAGLNVCIDVNSFELGAFLVNEMERAVIQSCKTLLVLTPAYFESGWAEFENILAQTSDPAARKRRLLPIILKSCRLPARISALNCLDFTSPENHDQQLDRLLASIKSAC